MAGICFPQHPTKKKFPQPLVRQDNWSKWDDIHSSIYKTFRLPFVLQENSRNGPVTHLNRPLIILTCHFLIGAPCNASDRLCTSIRPQDYFIRVLSSSSSFSAVVSGGGNAALIVCVCGSRVTGFLLNSINQTDSRLKRPAGKWGLPACSQEAIKGARQQWFNEQITDESRQLAN